MQSLTGKSTGATLTAAEWNQLPQEIQNIITALGLTLTNSDLDQLGKALSGMVAAGDYYADSGAANAYVIGTVLGQRPPAYIDGMRCRFRPGNANTGASTVNVNGLGVKNITRPDAAALLAGDIATTHDTLIEYDIGSGTFLLPWYAMQDEAPFAQGLLTASDALITGTDGYINMDTTLNAAGYGIRNASGVMELKNNGGDWGGFYSANQLSGDGTYERVLIEATWRGASPDAVCRASHSLGATPRIVMVYAECIDTTGSGNDYLVGDRIMLNSTAHYAGHGSWVSSTEVGFTDRQDQIPFNKKYSNAGFNPVAGDWKLMADLWL